MCERARGLERLYSRSIDFLSRRRNRGRSCFQGLYDCVGLAEGDRVSVRDDGKDLTDMSQLSIVLRRWSVTARTEWEKERQCEGERVAEKKKKRKTREHCDESLLQNNKCRATYFARHLCHIASLSAI